MSGIADSVSGIFKYGFTVLVGCGRFVDLNAIPEAYDDATAEDCESAEPFTPLVIDTT